MKNNVNNTASDKQRLSLTGAIKGVQRQMAALAPVPDQAGKKGPGPAFVKASTAVPANDDRDAMLGCLLFECFMGAAFGEAVSDAAEMPAAAQSVDWSQTIDAVDEFWTDRYGKNTRLGAKNIIGGSFNRTAAGQADMPKRMELEKQYAELARELEIVTASAWRTAASRHNAAAFRL